MKRQHSFEPPSLSSSAPATRKSPMPNSPAGPSDNSPPNAGSPPALLTSAAYDPASDIKHVDEDFIGSPLKKRRSSLQGLDRELEKGRGLDVFGLGVGFSGNGSFGGELSRPVDGGPSVSAPDIGSSSTGVKSETVIEGMEDEEL
ncbi:MAG: hypothetical protein Q9187_008684 [Circinaria calcarea]